MTTSSLIGGLRWISRADQIHTSPALGTRCNCATFSSLKTSSIFASKNTTCSIINELDKCDHCSNDPLQGKNVHGTTNIFCFTCNNQSSTIFFSCHKYN